MTPRVQHLPERQLKVLRRLLFMFVAAIGSFDYKGADLCYHDQVDDAFQRHIAAVSHAPSR